MRVYLCSQVAGTDPLARRHNACNELQKLLEQLKGKVKHMHVPAHARKEVQDDQRTVEWGFPVVKMLATDKEIMPGFLKRGRRLMEIHLTNKVCRL